MTNLRQVGKVHNLHQVIVVIDPEQLKSHKPFSFRTYGAEKIKGNEAIREKCKIL